MENSNNNQSQYIKNEISLRKYFNILITEKKLIIFITIIASIIGVSYSLLKKPVWRGEYKIVTKEKNSSQNLLLNNSNIQSIPLIGIKKSVDNKTK